MAECPYCLSLILQGDEVKKCETCGATYHAECFDENGGCAIKDCERRIRPKGIEIKVDAQPRTMLVLSRESVESVEDTPLAFPVKLHNPCLKCGAELPLGELYCPECDPNDPEKTRVIGLAPMVLLIGAIALIAGWLVISVLGPYLSNGGR